MTAIENELRRLKLIPENGQYGYGQPLWATGENDAGQTWIGDGQETETVDAGQLAAALAELDPDDDELFDRVWEAIGDAAV